ncbi:MAG: ABC transporter substrate-binding protein [Pseudomonadota bacterium]
MDRRQFIGAALACAGAVPAAAAGERLHIVTSNLPPLVVQGDVARHGALHELVVALCQRLQLVPEFEFVPWPRAQLLSTTRPATAIFPLTRQANREVKYRWLAPLYEENYVFMAPLEGRFEILSPARMKMQRVAILRGAGQLVILHELGYSRILEAGTVEEVHRFVVNGMADAVFGERNIILRSLRSRGVENDFVLSAPVRTTTAWLAGSQDFDAATAARFGQAMEGLKAEGLPERLLKKYDLV